MGFYLRKSISIGPFRFNLSKSGVGLSTGIRGFRVGTGPRGNYVHMGTHGVYYRATLPSAFESKTLSSPTCQPEIGTTEPETTVQSHDISAMTDLSSADLLEELRYKRRKVSLWPFIVIATLGSVTYVGHIRASDNVVISIVIAGLILSIVAAYYDRLRKTVILFYQLDPAIEEGSQKLHEAFDEMRKCSNRWYIQTKAKISDRKRNAGATQGIRRASFRLVRQSIPNMKCNLDVPSIPVGNRTLFLFPDRLLIFAGAKVGAIAYKDIKIIRDKIQYIEQEFVGRDVQVAGHTWRYVNKSGGPDRRFNNNREIPIVIYEQLAFSSPSGLDEIIQLSKAGACAALEKAIQAMSSLNCGTILQNELLNRKV